MTRSDSSQSLLQRRIWTRPCAFVRHFPPATTCSRKHAGNYGRDAQPFLASAAWGWHADVGLHVLKLFAAGFFDRCPRLGLILGYIGEKKCYRSILRGLLSVETGSISERRDGASDCRGFKVVWNENIWITTIGMFSISPMACLL